MDETPSTNDLARDYLLNLWQTDNPPPAASPVAFVAKRQTSGRGQHGRRWESPQGGLYLSAIVHDLDPRYRGRLALIAGVAAAAAVRDVTRVEPALRWPNDLVVDGRKLGGILCEAVALHDRWGGIVGIGLNVNTRLERLPPGVRPRSTSLLELTGKSVSLDHLELYLLGRLSESLARVRLEGLAPIIDRFARCDALAGRHVIVRVDDRTVEGAAAGITADGHLRVVTPAGDVALDRGTLLEIDGQQLRSE